jgi:hypothetical protein
MMAQKKPKQETAADPSGKMKSVEKEIVEKTVKTAKKVPLKKKAIKANATVSGKEQEVKEVAPVVAVEKSGTDHKTDRGSILLGAGLLFMGVVLLAGRFLRIPFGEFLWPFIFIVPGALVFLSAISSDSSSGEGLSILGGILSTLGLVFLMQTVTGLWASWAYIWALIAPTSIGLSQMVYGNLKGRDTIAASGWRLTKIGLSILVAGFIFFELIIGVSGFGLGRFGLPVFPMILIFFGAFMLVRSFFDNR